jgi:hypothetical protein
MLLFVNSLAFLLSISLSTLVIPSIIPKISFLTSLLLLGLIFLNSFFPYGLINPKTKLTGIRLQYQGFESIHFPFIVIFLLSIWVASRFLFNENVNPLSDMNLIALHILFLIFIYVTRHSLTSYLKVYVFFVFLMALLGLIANALFLLDMIAPEAHHVNISKLTGGSFTRDQSVLESYTFPYGMGFILTGDGQLNILGMQFYRISGWAHEPTSATLFVSPAILLLLHGEIIKGSILKFIMILTIGLFWLLALSVGSMLAFIILYSLVIAVYFFQHFFHKNRIMSIIFILTVVTIPILIIYIEPILSSTLFSSKFNLESHTLNTALNQLMWFLPSIEQPGIFYFYNLFLWMIILTFFSSAIYFLMNNSNNNVYALILLYIVIHSMKGSQTTVFYLIFTYFWLYVAYFASIENIETS